ncbi:MAG: endonuclease/exonuclease/phosphatase family protein [Candidatus Sumerlaeaceae bacterium]
MRIVSWNCNGGFAKKAGFVEDFFPDVAVVQECGPAPLQCKTGKLHHTCSPGERRGISVAVGAGFDVEPAAMCIQSNYFVPYRVTGKDTFNLVAVWAKPHPQGTGYYSPYTVSAALALKDLRAFLLERDTIVIGDFNSNAIWNHQAKPTHSEIHKMLEQVGLVSAYHEFFGEKPGNETRSTFRHHQNKNFYHIDYCYMPKAWLNRLRNVAIPAWPSGKAPSDHLPLIVELDDP